MSKYQSYPEYQKSNIEWVREIPCHWKVAPLKWRIEKIDGGVWGGDPDGISDTVVLRSTEQTVDGKWKIVNPAMRKLSKHEKDSTLLEENDLLMTKSSGSSLHIGKTSIVDKKIANLQCSYSNFMQRIRIKTGSCPKLYWYILNNNLARAQFDYLSNSTTGLANLNAAMIGELICPIPPEDEQFKIAAFLDHETAKIDTLIEKQQQLIKLLKEKRQAVISHAVTKGLNPDAPMKDSGVEWLGEVPEHWNVAPLKYLVKEKAAGPYGASLTKAMYVSNGVKVYGQQQVINDDFDIGDYYISENKYKEMIRYTVYPDDVLISVMGTVGKVAVVPSTAHHGIINPRLVRYKFNTSKIKPIFVQHLIMSIRYQNRLSEASQGSTMDGLNMGILGDLSLVLPPINEQTQIISEVNHQSSVYNKLINKAENIIVLFQERRTALISAAVTGKIDVRNWIAPTTNRGTNEAHQEVTA